MQQGKIDAQGVSAQLRAVAEDDFAEDHGMAEAAFRKVVGGRHVIDAQKSKEAVGVARGIDQPLAEVLRLRVRQGRLAEAVQPVLEGGDLGAGRGEGNLALVSVTAELANLGKEGLQLLAEAEGGGVLLWNWQQPDQLGGVPGFADQMGQTGLTMLGFDQIVRGVIVGDQAALETRSKDGEGDISRTGVIDLKETEVGIAGKPQIRGLSVDAPMRFIAMDDGGRPDLVADLFMDGFGGAGGASLKGQGRGRDKVQAEQPLEDSAHLAQREV